MDSDNAIEEELEERKKLEILKDLLINKYKGNKKFVHINNNEFLFDNKFHIKANLLDNSELVIEKDNNKYSLESFIASFCKEENNNSNNELNKKEKGNFIYTKKIMPQNEHQKRRRKKRIYDESEEET